MKAPNLKTMLMSELEPSFAKQGFKLEKAMMWYVNKRNDITHYFGLQFYTAREGFSIQPAIYVRSDTLDRIYGQVTGIKSTEQKKHTAIAFSIFRVYGDEKKYECLLRSEEDIKPAAEKLATSFNDVALPFFVKCSSIEAINALFGNPEDMARRLYMGDYFDRAMYATIAAKLAGNPNLPAIVAYYRTGLATYGQGTYADTYENLLKVLEEERETRPQVEAHAVPPAVSVRIGRKEIAQVLQRTGYRLPSECERQVPVPPARRHSFTLATA